MKCCLKTDTADSDLMSAIHSHCPARHFYVPVHDNPEAASAKWSRMLYFCTSRSVLLSTELHFLRSCEQQNRKRQIASTLTFLGGCFTATYI